MLIVNTCNAFPLPREEIEVVTEMSLRAKKRPIPHLSMAGRAHFVFTPDIFRDGETRKEVMKARTGGAF